MNIHHALHCDLHDKKSNLLTRKRCIYMYIRNRCNMSMRDLPDMYVRGPRAAGLRAEGIHIKQITSAHVATIMYHLCALFVHG